MKKERGKSNRFEGGIAQYIRNETKHTDCSHESLRLLCRSLLLPSRENVPPNK